MNPPLPIDYFEQALSVWRKAQVVTDAYRSDPIVCFDEVVAHPELYHDQLVAALNDQSQLVVAYCLLALEKMKSPALAALPDSLLARREKITIRFGSFSTSSDLGGLARQLKKKNEKRA
jgi:hypothetical protein